MKKLLSAVVLTIGVISTLVSVSAEDLRSNGGSATKHSDWYVSYELGRFSDNAGLHLDDFPGDTDRYTVEKIILSGKIGVGYRVSPRLSLGLQYALGPNDRIEIYSGGDYEDRFSSRKSYFTSLVVNREFQLSSYDSVDVKFGVTRATFENRTRLGQSNEMVSRNTEVKPLVALGYRREFAKRWSGVFEITNYFLSDPGSVTTATMGIRYDL